jgi:hypothetical protein
VDGHAEETDARPDDLGEVGDRGFLDAIEGQLAAAGRAGRQCDGDLDGGFGELLGGRRRAMAEHPLTGLATGPLGGPDSRPLGERRRLPLARASEFLDLGLQRRDHRGLLEDQGHQLIAPQSGEVGFRHRRQDKEMADTAARGSLINYPKSSATEFAPVSSDTA